MRYLLITYCCLLLASCNSTYKTAGSVPLTYDSGIAPNLSTSDRKIIRSARIDLSVTDPDSTVVRLIKLAEELEGYVAQSGTDGATLRLPAAALDHSLERIATYGKVTDRSISGQDVTEEYRDVGIRLDNAERSRQRYLELLAKAQNVEETLLVERELERLTETIDRLKGRQQLLDNQEAFATVRVYVRERVRPGPLGYVVKGLYGVVRWLFVRN